MWNKLFKNKSKTNQNKSKLSIVVKSFSLKKNSKDNDVVSANDLAEQVTTLTTVAGIYCIQNIHKDLNILYKFSYTFTAIMYLFLVIIVKIYI